MKHEILNCKGFQWDQGNSLKNQISHDVSISESEQIFFNQPLIVGYDQKHSLNEDRYYVLGQTDEGRELFIVFTIRDNLISVISAREMSKKEKVIYQS